MSVVRDHRTSDLLVFAARGICNFDRYLNILLQFTLAMHNFCKGDLS